MCVMGGGVPLAGLLSLSGSIRVVLCILPTHPPSFSCCISLPPPLCPSPLRSPHSLLLLQLPVCMEGCRLADFTPEERRSIRIPRNTARRLRWVACKRQQCQFRVCSRLVISSSGSNKINTQKQQPGLWIKRRKRRINSVSTCC